jgi:hypothetical protein
MKIAVFDTYIRRPDGRRMHFDILVDDANKGLDNTEPGHPTIEEKIRREGFAIIEMENSH